MKHLRIFSILAFVGSGPLAPQATADTAAPVAAAPAAALSQADQDWQEFWAVANQRPAKPDKEMSPLERATFFETRALRVRELGLAFIENHPTDPRRWSAVLRFVSQFPRFAKEWGSFDDKGFPINPVVDEAATVAWRARFNELMAAMAAATDLPDDARKWVTLMAGQKARQTAFQVRWQSGVATPAPDFVALDLAGREVKLSDFRGKVVVLDFWAPWCGPCLAAMPHGQKLAADYKEQGLVILACCTSDTRENFEKWVKENQAKYPDLLWVHDPDAKGEERVSKKLYDVAGIPTQFIIDREGRVVDAVVGYSEGDVVLDAALAKAGIKVDPAVLAKAAADQKQRSNR